MTEPEELSERDAPEKVEDQAVEKEEKKKRARLRTQGPYRKAHVDL